jgi:hypothetical protein
MLCACINLCSRIFVKGLSAYSIIILGGASGRKIIIAQTVHGPILGISVLCPAALCDLVQREVFLVTPAFSLKRSAVNYY